MHSFPMVFLILPPDHLNIYIQRLDNFFLDCKPYHSIKHGRSYYCHIEVSVHCVHCNKTKGQFGWVKEWVNGIENT